MPLLALPFPALNPVIVELGPFAIRWYALAYIAGILLGWLYARAIIRSRSAWRGPAPLTVADFDDFILWVTLGIILGGRTGYVLFYNLPHFVAHPIEIPQLWKGGMSFHGGFIGCVLAVVLFARSRGIPVFSLGDLTCAVGPIGLFLGRIANFINGELWGRPSDVPWAMVFPGAGPLPRHPSQLYEAGLEGLVLFAVLAILIRAGALKRPGSIIGAFALGYGVARCIAELFREPDPQLGFLWGGLTMGMLLSIPMILAGLAFLFSAAGRLPRHEPRMNALEAEIRKIIAVDGPIPVAQFMALALGHPAHGYYAGRDPFGARGDFITAPEISQMFGELIGLWAAAVWGQMGSPDRIRLVELGPGRGTLMADALRAAKIAKEFYAALAVDLVEISPALRRRQAQTLADADVPLSWHATLAEVPERNPLIVIANEFFDALPVNQAVRGKSGWHERMVGLGDDGKLMLALHPDPIVGFSAMLPAELRDAPVGAIWEWRSDAWVADLARRTVRQGGAALIVDYGHAGGLGETLQAVGGHAFAEVLERPGEVDLSAHVDFSALGRAAARWGARVHGPVTQREFLTRLGIETRAAMLKTATEARAAEIDAALARLTEAGPRGMGELFKAVALADPKLGALPGFG